MPQIIKLTSLCAVDEVSRILKKDRSNINAVDESGNTPLHLAFSLGNSALIKIFIDAGADPTQLNLSGSRPLDLARDEVEQDVINQCGQYESAMTNISSASFVSEPERMNGSYESFESFNPSQTLSNFLDENNHQGSVYRGARVIVQHLSVRIEETLRSALLRFRHPNLCLIMGLIRTSNDNVSVIYESCPGGSLKEALKMVQFSSGQKMKILSDISHALYYMHSNCPSMIHPSLDTGNILLDTVVEHELDYVNVKIGDICSLQPGDPSDDIPRFGNIACEVFPDMPQPIHEFIQRCVSVDVYSRPQTIDICRVFKTGT